MRQVYAMAGASKRHNRITGNIYRAVTAVETPCTAYISAMKVHSEKYHSYYYPDVVGGCDRNETVELSLPCPLIKLNLASIYDGVALF